MRLARGTTQKDVIEALADMAKDFSAQFELATVSLAGPKQAR